MVSLSVSPYFRFERFPIHFCIRLPEVIFSYYSCLSAVDEIVVFYIFLVILSTWGATALGASAVFFVKEINQRLMNGMFGFASGVMLAASFWSLLLPSIAMSAELGWWPWFPPLCGFLAGGAFLWCIDKILPHLHFGEHHTPEGVPANWRRSLLLLFALTIHKIPEGLAIGIAFGAAFAGMESATLMGAVSLMIGLSIQSVPESAAVVLPLRTGGLSRFRCFLCGQFLGAVGTITAGIGALLVTLVQVILPFALPFAAGAMFYVIIEELIPTSHQNENSDAGTIGAIIGFAIMMTLDIALG